jgi:RNA polymerase sigma factor (sigma-70 family)
MSDPNLHTTQLRLWLDRMQGGDPTARDELIRATSGRLERLARKMLRGYPQVARWEETDDVLNNALVRLIRALQEVRPGSVREFFGLAAEQVRRELLDLKRHYQGPLGLGANHASAAALPDEKGGVPDRSAPEEAPAEAELWSSFHEAVEQLPTEEREVVSLTFYHGMTQLEIAELLGTSERTIRRYWREACLRLHTALGGRLPTP